MNRRDLNVGDKVFCRLSYEGGVGWATILDLNAEPPPFGRKTETVKVEFDCDALYCANQTRTISPARILRKKEEVDA